jgi:hypothetical protein
MAKDPGLFSTTILLDTRATGFASSHPGWHTTKPGLPTILAGCDSPVYKTRIWLFRSRIFCLGLAWWYFSRFHVQVWLHSCWWWRSVHPATVKLVRWLVTRWQVNDAYWLAPLLPLAFSSSLGIGVLGLHHLARLTRAWRQFSIPSTLKTR